MPDINSVRLIISKFKSMPVEAFLFKLWRKIGAYPLIRYAAWRDVRFGTWQNKGFGVDASFIDAHELNLGDLDSESWSYQCSQYLNHCFDLLGSGPVNVAHSARYNGIENHKFQTDSFRYGSRKDIVRRLLLPPFVSESLCIVDKLDANYVPIDWQVDFKSGFRWSEKTPSSRIVYGNVLGADIKLPWELARLQHLPRLAIQALRDSENSLTYCREIRNQILDFIAMNPPRMGVNWVCAMDVGIRVANMLIANDIAENAVGYPVDNGYRKIFAQSVFEHGMHILGHLEYSPELTSNHYLANIIGLLFVSAYLESNQTTNQWLAFSIQEMISEVKRQYYDDGTNFEGSSSYHRLSTEMIVYGIALIRGLPRERVESLETCPTRPWKIRPVLRAYGEQEYKIVNSKVELPEWVCQRVASAVQFSIAITKPDGKVCQFGDNDSGRFLKLTSIGAFMDKEVALKKYLNLSEGEALEYRNDKYWDDDCLNHSAYISAASAIFGAGLPEYITRCELERSITLSLSKSNLIDVKPVPMESAGTQEEITLSDLVYKKSIEIKVRPADLAGDSLLNGLRQFWYPDSQVLVFRSAHLYLCLYCVPNGSKGNGAHSHNDQLSVEIMIDGHDICKDSGTYLYTCIPVRRNQFRSVNAHNTLRTGAEPNGFFGTANALFAKENNTQCFFSEISRSSGVMAMRYDRIVQRRAVEVLDDRIVIDDQSNGEFDNALNPSECFSNGYGKLMAVRSVIANVEIEYKS